MEKHGESSRGFDLGRCHVRIFAESTSTVDALNQRIVGVDMKNPLIVTRVMVVSMAWPDALLVGRTSDTFNGSCDTLFS